MKKRLLIALVVVLALAATASLVWATSEGLVSYWPLDGTANDVVNGNHGTVYGATYVGGKVGQALSFDGSNDYVQLPASNSILDIDTFTVQAWFKTSVNHPVYGSGEGRMVNLHRMDTASTAVSLYVEADKIGLLYYTGSAHVWVKYTVNYHDGEWHHIAVTHDATTYRLYYDGAEVASQVDGFGAFGTFPAYLGTFNSSERFFNGVVDEVGVWNRALTDDEVAALSVGVGWLEWLPPIALEDWTLNGNATLPIKFQLYHPYGDLICTDLNPKLEVNDVPLDLRFDSTECYYITNFRPPGIDGYTATVSLNGVTLGERGFTVVDPPVAYGRGKKGD